MTGYSVDVVSDSISPDGVRLTTLLTRYPWIIHPEVLRHRMISHSVASSRAMPTERLIEQVRDDPFVPETFNERVKGMGVGAALDVVENDMAVYQWRRAAIEASSCAHKMVEIGVDKSRANAPLLPYLYVTDLMTATEWSNFLALRDHPDARPEIQRLARMVREALDDTGAMRVVHEGQWHLPYVDRDFLYDSFDGDWEPWKMASAGRCARVSYDRQDDNEPPGDSVVRARKLVESGHMSPFEHIARPMNDDDVRGESGDWVMGYGCGDGGPHDLFCGNLRGWVSMRKEFPHEDDFSKLLAAREAL